MWTEFGSSGNDRPCEKDQRGFGGEPGLRGGVLVSLLVTELERENNSSLGGVFQTSAPLVAQLVYLLGLKIKIPFPTQKSSVLSLLKVDVSIEGLFGPLGPSELGGNQFPVLQIPV